MTASKLFRITRERQLVLFFLNKQDTFTNIKINRLNKTINKHAELKYSVPGHWKGTSGPSLSSSSSSSSFSLFSLSSFSVSLPSSRPLRRMPRSAPDSPFSMPRLLPPLTGTSESPLVRVRLLIRRCLCVTKTQRYPDMSLFHMCVDGDCLRREMRLRLLESRRGLITAERRCRSGSEGRRRRRHASRLPR